MMKIKWTGRKEFNDRVELRCEVSDLLSVSHSNVLVIIYKEKSEPKVRLSMNGPAMFSKDTWDQFMNKIDNEIIISTGLEAYNAEKMDKLHEEDWKFIK